MKYYFIDYENTNERAFKCIEPDGDSRIVLVYSKNANKISIDIASRYKIEYIKVASASQAADMFIVYYIGTRIYCFEPDDEIIIISDDGDYDGLITTLRGDLKISRIPAKEKPVVSDATKHNNLVVQSLKNSGLKDNENGKIAKQIASFLRNGNAVKMNTYRWLVTVYGMKKGLELYNSIKEVL